MQWNILADALAFNSFDRVPDELLHWNVRLPLIVHHIKDQNPDILVLEECDKFDSIMAALGTQWHGVFGPKKGQEIGNAIIWRPEKVQAEGDKLVSFFPEMTQNYVCQSFLYAGTSFKVVATHLKAKPEFTEIRNIQCKHLIDTLPNTEKTLIFGDFNDTPDSEPVKMLKEKFPSLAVEFTG